ncbi:MAG TPA: hypothetical protein VK254_03055 [Candidatus Bathyarchaeia archaeon]|nr:hypothetical protein [Candidatus Bathyarchaeia archaeon]
MERINPDLDVQIGSFYLCGMRIRMNVYRSLGIALPMEKSSSGDLNGRMLLIQANGGVSFCPFETNAIPVKWGLTFLRRLSGKEVKSIKKIFLETLSGFFMGKTKVDINIDYILAFIIGL